MTYTGDAIAPRIYTVAQLADILQVSPATVRANTTKGTWPYMRVGPRIIRFTDDHLATILAGSEVEVTPKSSIKRRRTRRPSL